MTPSEFAATYIGKPWASGEDGPQSFDCWGLVRAYYRETRGLWLPVVDVNADAALAVRRAFNQHENRRQWSEVAHPTEGCAVLMSQARHADHVGVWFDGRVLHSVRGAGVILSDSISLRLSGWKAIGYYEASLCSPL